MTSDRLKRIVRVRRLMENSRAADLRRSRNQLDSARQKLDDAGQQIVDHDQSLETMKLDADLEEMAVRYRKVLQTGRVQQAQNVATHTDLVAESQATVARAHQDRRLMEKLHDRVRARELQTLAEGEAKTHAAIALTAHVRKGDPTK
jgi:hypothetical protein